MNLREIFKLAILALLVVLIISATSKAFYTDTGRDDKHYRTHILGESFLTSAYTTAYLLEGHDYFNSSKFGMQWGIILGVSWELLDETYCIAKRSGFRHDLDGILDPQGLNTHDIVIDIAGVVMSSAATAVATWIIRGEWK